MEVAVGKPRGCWSHVGSCRSTSGVRGEDTVVNPITPPLRCAVLGRFVLELVSLPVNALTQKAARWLRFDIHAAGWLHFMDVSLLYPERIMMSLADVECGNLLACQHLVVRIVFADYDSTARRALLDACLRRHEQAALC